MLCNQRPISVLPVFSKGFENIIHLRLTKFFEKYSIITHSQCGFRRGRFPELALLQQKELILNNLVNKQLVLGIFIDLSKAFDCLNHETLLKKLERYGIRGQALELLCSYLKHRQQTVAIEGRSFAQKHLKGGVPQCTVLGPLLFNIHINDIVNISKAAEFIIYSDDTRRTIL